MDFQVLLNDECGHCREAYKAIQQLVRDLPGDHELTSVDVASHPEAADRFGLQACPGLVVGDELAFVGVPGPRELRECLEGRLEFRMSRRYEEQTGRRG